MISIVIGSKVFMLIRHLSDLDPEDRDGQQLGLHIHLYEIYLYKGAEFP